MDSDNVLLFIPHIEMIKDTLLSEREEQRGEEGTAVSSRSLEYATEKIVQLINEKEDSNGALRKSFLVKRDDGSCDIEVLVNCLEISNDENTLWNIIKIINYVSSLKQNRGSLVSIQQQSTKKPHSASTYIFKPCYLIDTLINKLKNVSKNEIQNDIHTILYKLLPQDEDFSERAHELDLITHTVALSTRMVNHGTIMPVLLIIMKRFTESTRKNGESKGSRQQRQVTFCHNLGRHGCVNIYSRILKRYSNDNKDMKLSLSILKHCVYALIAVMKNESNINQGTSCVPELVSIFDGLQKKREEGNLFKEQVIPVAALQKAIVIALMKTYKSETFPKLKQKLYEFAKGSKCYKSKFVFSSLCAMLYKSLQPTTLKDSFEHIITLDHLTKDGSVTAADPLQLFPELQQQVPITENHSDDSSPATDVCRIKEKLVFKCPASTLMSQVGVKKTKKKGDHSHKLSCVLLKNVEREMPQGIESHVVYSSNGHTDSSSSLVFEASAESCNLHKVLQIRDNEYDVLISPDTNTSSYQEWFMFKIRCGHDVRTPYRINIINCIKKKSHFKLGVRPLLYSLSTDTWLTFSSPDVFYYRNNILKNSTKQKCYYYTATFYITFPTANSSYYLAHSLPYTYSMLQNDVVSVRTSISNESILCHNQTLCTTQSGLSCPLLTITESSSSSHSTKSYVIITGRSHSGITISSWLIRGIIQFLLSSDERAVELRKTYIFKIIPMLNIDGVIYGNQCCYLSGHVPSKQWSSKASDSQPTAITATKDLIKWLTDEGKHIKMFCELQYSSTSNKTQLLYNNSTAGIHQTSDSCTLIDVKTIKKLTKKTLSCNVVQEYSHLVDISCILRSNVKNRYQLSVANVSELQATGINFLTKILSV